MKRIIVLTFALLFISASFVCAQTILVPAGNGYIDPSTGTYYSGNNNRGLVNTGTGTYMAPSGNGGFINTQNGQYVPAAPKHNNNNNKNNNYNNYNNYNGSYNYGSDRND